ncbi:MAG: ATP-binding cassette domain-containing protein [Patescibacteria group bacterium]|nr:ATP-binding cassette domain-containing protein [Patescibacteria group bacterium]
MSAKSKNQKAIEVSNLTKRFEKLIAVDHISFTVEKGEIFGFLGPNGAGKTTTIRMLTGLTKPTGGQAKIFGFDIQTETIKAKRKMGIVPETSNVYDDLSAWDNLIFTAQLYGMRRNATNKKAEELLKIFGLFNRRNYKVKDFSKGMKRKLTIAMGLVNDPQLLFLDEPTSGLDVESALIIKKTINDLSEQGITIFLTTHDIEEANKNCDRVAIINHGRIAAIDTPEKLKNTIKSVQSVEAAFDKTISFRDISSLKELPFIGKIEKLGDKYKIFTDKPEKTLSILCDWSRKNKLEIISLNTFGPNLEEVFIKLTKNK